MLMLDLYIEYINGKPKRYFVGSECEAVGCFMAGRYYDSSAEAVLAYARESGFTVEAVQRTLLQNQIHGLSVEVQDGCV